MPGAASCIYLFPVLVKPRDRRGGALAAECVAGPLSGPLECGRLRSHFCALPQILFYSVLAWPFHPPPACVRGHWARQAARGCSAMRACRHVVRIVAVTVAQASKQATSHLGTWARRNPLLYSSVSTCTASTSSAAISHRQPSRSPRLGLVRPRSPAVSGEGGTEGGPTNNTAKQQPSSSAARRPAACLPGWCTGWEGMRVHELNDQPHRSSSSSRAAHRAQTPLRTCPPGS